MDLSELAGTQTSTKDGASDFRFMLSLSTTARGDGLPNATPANGYDGALYISPGQLLDRSPFTGGNFVVPTGDFTTHEFNELYLRTHDKLSYPDAHKKAGGHKTTTGYIYDK